MNDRTKIKTPTRPPAFPDWQALMSHLQSMPRCSSGFIAGPSQDGAAAETIIEIHDAGGAAWAVDCARHLMDYGVRPLRITFAARTLMSYSRNGVLALYHWKDYYTATHELKAEVEEAVWAVVIDHMSEWPEVA